MLREIIYDFDGTLSDSYPVFTEALLAALKKCGIEDSYEHVYSMLKVNFKTAFGSYGLNETGLAELSREYSGFYSRIAMDMQKPVPGAEEILGYAAGRGGRNYIFTHSGEIVKRLLEKWGLLKHFTGIVDKTFRINPKPAPDGVLLLINNYGISRGEALIVGDRDIDIMSGKAAGIAGCLFDPEHFFDRAGCDYRITKLAELTGIICAGK